MNNEFSRTLYLANSPLLKEYNCKALTILAENDILFLPQQIEQDIIPYLQTKVGNYQGIREIELYSIEVNKIRQEKGLTRRSDEWEDIEPNRRETIRSPILQICLASLDRREQRLKKFRAKQR